MSKSKKITKPIVKVEKKNLKMNIENNYISKSAVSTWDFTSFDTNVETTKELLKKFCKKWTFQKELCKSTKKEHLQGRFSLKVKERLSTLKNKFPVWHLSITSKENMGNNFYVTKEDSRLEGPWSDSDVELFIPDDVKEMTTLRPWQDKLRKILNTYDKRLVDIVIQPEGSCGKTSLTRYLMIYDDAMILPFCNDYKDIMRMAYDVGPKKIYLIDMPRAINKEKLYQLYGAIETLKSGYCYDDRYGFKYRLFNRPRICIFTNKDPDLKLLSKDMWNIWKIENHKLLAVDKNDFTF